MPHIIIQKLSHSARKDNLLRKIENALWENLQMRPVIGAEIEFYVKNKEILQKLPYEIKEEKGQNQFEIDIFPASTLHETVEAIAKAQNTLSSYAEISTHPKPHPQDYGSAMHFHINFVDTEGNNIFDNIEHIEHAAKTLCHFLLPSFLIFAPHDYDYARFDPKFMAPTKACFGNNNRSVAIRIPDARPRRIEHRIASSETDAYLAIYSILKALYIGFTQPKDIPYSPKVYGNAFDAQYNLPPLPKNIMEADRLFEEKLWME